MQNRYHYISFARVLAAIGVITLHTAEWYVKVSEEPYWLLANIIVAFAETSVPIFFMISGALLLDYREKYTTKEFFQKRFCKVLLPLLFWFIIAMIYGYFMDTTAMSMPYWFFFVLAGMYICMPVFSAIPKDIREQVILYIIIISFVFNYLFPFLANVFHFTITYAIPFDIGAGYIIYILIGYLLHKKSLGKKWTILISFLAILGFVLKVGGTYILSLEKGELDGTFGHYFNVPCILLSIGMYVLLKEIGNKIKSEKLIHIIEFLSSCTMASYVLHQYVLEYIIRPHVSNVYTLRYNLIAPILNFLICVGITCLLRRIPIIKKIVP